MSLWFSGETKQHLILKVLQSSTKYPFNLEAGSVMTSLRSFLGTKNLVNASCAMISELMSFGRKVASANNKTWSRHVRTLHLPHSVERSPGSHASRQTALKGASHGSECIGCCALWLAMLAA